MIKSNNYYCTRFMLYFALFLVQFSFAQNFVVIDTSNTAFKTKIAEHFNYQFSKTELRINEIEDKNIRKQFLTDYSDKKEELQKLTKKGIFVEHNSYSILIEDLFKKIKDGNPNMQFQEIKLLLAISEDINAYNCGDGIIVINLPLIFNIENEFELAYVISHEVGHQKLDHVYKSMLKHSQLNNSNELRKKTSEINKQKFNKNNLASRLYKNIVYGNREQSRIFEHQADSLGYILFRNAFPAYESYSIETLRKLKTIDKEQDSLSKADFKRFFEVSDLKFKEEWLASEITQYNYQKSEKFWNVDSLRTHPDCDSRIAFLKRNFKIQDKSKSIDNSNFNKQKKNADEEFVFGLYFLEEYGKSLYYSLLNTKKNPNNLFLKNMIYKNLTKLRDARNNYNLNKFLETEKPNFSDSYNQFLCLIRNVRKNELDKIIEFYK